MSIQGPPIRKGATLDNPTTTQNQPGPSGDAGTGASSMADANISYSQVSHASL